MENSDVHTETSFPSLGISKQFLVEGLEYFGFKYATPVQVNCIPKALNGDNLIVQGKNGTGKTLAFTLVALETLEREKCEVQVIVLTSTREVASQIFDFVNELSFTSDKPVYSLLCCGGYSRKDTIKALKEGVHLIIGTVGRIKDLSSKFIDLKAVKMVIIDEADKICTDLDSIISNLSENCQVLAFSATFNTQSEGFLMSKIPNAAFLKASGDDMKLKQLQEFYTTCEDNFKAKLMKVLEILNTIPFHQCIIFHNYKSDGSDLANTLRDHNFPTLHISSELGQEQRIEVIRSLRYLKIKVLLSTDLSSRGLDVLNVNLVLNFDFPGSKETYIHRVGRAGRFGTPGVSVTLCGSEEKVGLVKGFSCVKELSEFKVSGYCMRVIPCEEKEALEEVRDGWVDVENEETLDDQFKYPVKLDELKGIFCELCRLGRFGAHCHCQECRVNYGFLSKYLS